MDDETFLPKSPGTRKTNAPTDGRSMKAAPFDSTPEFQHFKEVMRAVLAVPKKRIDELVQEAKQNSPRRDNPHAPGQKRARKRRTTTKRGIG